MLRLLSSKAKGIAKIFENHLNPVMLVFMKRGIIVMTIVCIVLSLLLMYHECMTAFVYPYTVNEYSFIHWILRRVPMCQSFSHFSGILHHFVLASNHDRSRRL